MTTPENEIGPLWPPPGQPQRRSRWVVPVATLAALVLVAATALATWALTRSEQPNTPEAAATDTTSATPIPTEEEREQHAHDTMTSDDEVYWLKAYDVFESQADRSAAMERAIGTELAAAGITMDEVDAFAPGFCESVEQVGMVPALAAAMTKPDPDNPGMLIPEDGNPALLAAYGVPVHCPWYVAEFDRAIET